jgi:p-methyltransferase
LRRVYFTDDNLFTSKARAREILNVLLESGMPIRWRGLIRIDIVDDELADLMARSGCLEVLLGIESGDADMLRRMNKRVSPDRILEGIGILSQYGIHTKSTFLIGFPGETDASIQNTVDLLNAYPTNGDAMHRYLFFTFAVLPLSSVASPASRAKYDLKGYGYHWEHKTMDSAGAAARLEALHDRIRDDLTPNYVLEVPEVPGIAVPDLKRICRARNELARLQRGGFAAIRDTEQWRVIAAPFLRRG